MICNLKAYDLAKNSHVLAAFESSNDFKSLSNDRPRDYTDKIGELLKLFVENDSTIGFQLKEMLLSCEYQGVACQASDFVPYHDFDYGNCYRFNGGDAQRVSRKEGWQSGLRVELFSGLDERYAYKSGFRIVVHNQSRVAFADDDGIDVSTGRQTNVAIRRHIDERLAKPYSNCVERLDASDIEATNEPLRAMLALMETGVIGKYQQNICFKICTQQYINGKCKCVDTRMRAYMRGGVGGGGVKYCASKWELTCLRATEADFYRSDQAESCYRNNCPIECSSVVYDLKVSIAE